MSRKRVKQYITLLMVAGLVAVVANTGGTFATFTAATTNPNNTFATGTLFLHNTANGGTVCTSESGSSNTKTCDTLFSETITPGTPMTADLTLTNAGTLNASTIQFYTGGCSEGAPTIASLSSDLTGNSQTSISVSSLSQNLVGGTPITVTDANNTGNTTQSFIVGSAGATASSAGTTIPIESANVNGTFSASTPATVTLDTSSFTSSASLCTGMNFSIEELGSSGGTSVACVWGTSNGSGGCATSSPTSYNLTTPSSSSSAPSSLSLNSAGGSVGTTFPAGNTRYLKLIVTPPSSLPNSDQNDQVTIDFTWQITAS